MIIMIRIAILLIRVPFVVGVVVVGFVHGVTLVVSSAPPLLLLGVLVVFLFFVLLLLLTT